MISVSINYAEVLDKKEYINAHNFMIESYDFKSLKLLRLLVMQDFRFIIRLVTKSYDQLANL